MVSVSKLRRLPSELREEIYARFDAGESVDAVYAFLTGMDIDTSRAGVGRFRLNWLRAVKAEREAESTAAMMVRDLAEVPEDKVTRRIGKLVKTGLIRAVTALEEKMEDDPATALEAFMEASKAYYHLARADSYAVDATVKATEFSEAEAAKAARTLDVTGATPTLEIAFVDHSDLPVGRRGKGKGAVAPREAAVLPDGDLPDRRRGKAAEKSKKATASMVKKGSA